MRLIVLGGSGDLMSRYLGPALLELEEAKELEPDFCVVGASREDWSDEDFRKHVLSEIAASEQNGLASRRLGERLSFRRVDATDLTDLKKLIVPGDPVIAYLALPPSVAGDVVESIAAIGLSKQSRLVIEKPFGEDLRSARLLNERIRKCFHEDAVFRVDHFLAMPAVRNLLPLRFANPLFRGVWTAKHIERVDIVWEEQNTLEGRAGYYDGIGALRDMVQNHLLQVLCLLAMEPPATLRPCDVRAARANVLRSVAAPSVGDAARCSQRARYTAGRSNGVPAYVEEEGVDASLNTETFVELVLRVETETLSGVPFVIRTGKGLARDRRFVDIVSRDSGVGLWEHAPRNRVRLGLEPATIEIGLNLNDDATGGTTRAELRGEAPKETVSAYGRVLRSILTGEASISVGAEEAEEAWRVVEPFLSAFQSGESQLLQYPAGSDGPAGLG